MIYSITTIYIILSNSTYLICSSKCSISKHILYISKLTAKEYIVKCLSI
nr:MAG TPA: hypothetical protein [Caudoviricetes sp.]